MTDTTSSLKDLIEKTQDYIETRIELTRLKTIDKSTDVLATMITLVLVAFMGLLCFVFLSFGLAYVLGSLTGSTATGFFIVAGIYGLALLLAVLLREKLIKTPVSNTVIKKLLK